MDADTRKKLMLVWGLVPLLDIGVGYWNYDKNKNHDNWEEAYVAELGWGALNLIAWGAANFAKLRVAEAAAIRGTTLMEAVDLWLVYQANRV